MGHIIIDIEDTTSNNKDVHQENLSLLKELETEVYHNGYLAGYVLTDMELYHIEMNESNGEEEYLIDVRNFITQQYLQLLSQIEKIFKKVSKLCEVIQYSIQLNQNLLVNTEIDQVFGILYSIHKQLSLFEISDDKICTKDGIAKRDELRKDMEKEIETLVQQSFIMSHNSSEIICLCNSLLKLSQSPLIFEVVELDAELTENTKSLNYDKVRDLYYLKLR